MTLEEAKEISSDTPLRIKEDLSSIPVVWKSNPYIKDLEELRDTPLYKTAFSKPTGLYNATSIRLHGCYIPLHRAPNSLMEFGSINVPICLLELFDPPVTDTEIIL